MLLPIEDWALDDVRAVAVPGFDESSELEKKASAKFDLSPGGPATETRAEIAKQIAAFANAGGGFLVYGVKDARDGGGLDDGVPAGVDRQRVREWLESIAAKVTIPPVVNCTARFIDYPHSPGRGALILHIPSSEARPHWVVQHNREIAYLRVGSHSLPMGLQTFLDIHSRGAASGVSIEDLSAWERVRETDRPVVAISPAVCLRSGPATRTWLLELSVDLRVGHFSTGGGLERSTDTTRVWVESTAMLYPQRVTVVCKSQDIFLVLKADPAPDSTASIVCSLFVSGAPPVRRSFTVFRVLNGGASAAIDASA
jgi:hypothetical protein